MLDVFGCKSQVGDGGSQSLPGLHLYHHSLLQRIWSSKLLSWTNDRSAEGRCKPQLEVRRLVEGGCTSLVGRKRRYCWQAEGVLCSQTRTIADDIGFFESYLAKRERLLTASYLNWIIVLIDATRILNQDEILPVEAK